MTTSITQTARILPVLVAAAWLAWASPTTAGECGNACTITSEDNPSLLFDDSSPGVGVWEISAFNDLAQLTIGDDLGVDPFRIERGAADNLLVLDAADRIGINTLSPLEELEIESTLPGIRLDDTSSGAGHADIQVSTNMLVLAGTTGVDVIRVSTDSPFAIGITDTGDVGIGTISPEAQLHVLGSGIIEGDVSLGSSRTIKHEIEPLDGAEVLRVLRGLPLYTWKYKDDPLQAAHAGPMAEDVHAAFRLGRDQKHLSPADSAGLALAAVQGVDQQVADLRSVVENLTARNGVLASENHDLRQRLAALEGRLGDLLAATGSTMASGAQSPR